MRNIVEARENCGFYMNGRKLTNKIFSAGYLYSKANAKKKKNKNSCRWTDEMPRGRVAFRRPVVRQMGLKCRA